MRAVCLYLNTGGSELSCTHATPSINCFRSPSSYCFDSVNANKQANHNFYFVVNEKKMKKNY